MFREILPILAYMSVLSSTYSLHMTRDAYIKAPPPPPAAAAQLLEELDDMSELLAENSIPAGPPPPPVVVLPHMKQPSLSAAAAAAHHHHQQQQQQLMSSQGDRTAPHGVVVINHLTSNELPELSPPPVRHPVGPLIQPRGLQELFGVQTNYDLRNSQQQLPLQQHNPNPNDNNNNDLGSDEDQSQQQQQQQKRTPNTNNNKRSSYSHSNGGGGSSMESGGGGPMDSSSGGGGGSSSSGNMPSIPHNMASQLMLRSARGQRQYDVPQIGEYQHMPGGNSYEVVFRGVFNALLPVYRKMMSVVQLGEHCFGTCRFNWLPDIPNY